VKKLLSTLATFGLVCGLGTGIVGCPKTSPAPTKTTTTATDKTTTATDKTTTATDKTKTGT